MATKTLSEPAFLSRISKRVPVAAALLAADAFVTFLIISFVPYTKIDWDAYMSQVCGFLGGERDYENLEGDTGPLVYPAGFLYVYSAIQFITGGQVYLAQILFAILYIINLGIVFFIYMKANVLPWWAFCLLCLSKRVHSIFVLRLFNDCFATTLLHASLALLLSEKWHLALIIFSGAVSIKMNVLLYAPSLLLLMLKGMHIGGVISATLAAASVQIFLAFPFLLSHPISYISRAFNLGRVFIHFWSVNFKFVPEEIFVSKKFAITLVVLHLALLTAFAHYKWCRYEGGIFMFLRSRIFSGEPGSISMFSSSAQFFAYKAKPLNVDHMVTLMFVGNFIGIICARSLHYQFYSWYFYSLPYLLWKTRFPTPIRLILFAGVELCWNIYPSNVYSSILLFCIHMTILLGIWFTPCEYPYIDSQKLPKKDE